MAEKETAAFDQDPGLNLDAPGEKEKEQYLEVETNDGKRLKLKVVFSAVDPVMNAAYVFVEQGSDEVLALATKLDDKGAPTQDEFEQVGIGSPYLDAVKLYLQAYNEGNLTADTLSKRVTQLRQGR